MRPKNKKFRLEFSQKVTLSSAIFSMAIVFLVLLANFLLIFLEKNPMTQETITTITVYGGITSTLTFGGYCALTLGRNHSTNKLKEKEIEN